MTPGTTIETPWLTIADVAAHLKVSGETIRMKCVGGSIRCMRVGRLYRIHIDELHRLEKEAIPPRPKTQSAHSGVDYIGD